MSNNSITAKSYITIIIYSVKDVPFEFKTVEVHSSSEQAKEYFKSIIKRKGNSIDEIIFARIYESSETTDYLYELKEELKTLTKQ